MAHKWLQIVQQALSSDDGIQSSYPVKYKDAPGYLVLSKQRILFVEERGFLSKSYHLTVNLPFESVSECHVSGEKGFIILDEQRGTYAFTTSFKASIITQRLNELLQSKPRKVKAVAKAA